MRGPQNQHSGTADGTGPIRTCVGCRGRDSDSRLLRIVHDPEAAALSPDPRRRARGRGVWVHREERCIATALDRKAFPRALRIGGNVSQDAISEVLDALRSGHETTSSTEPVGGGSTRRGTDQTR